MTDEQPLGQAGDRLRIERQRNGLRPKWGERCQLMCSHPELAVVHLEVRTVVDEKVRPLCYAAVPLHALRTGQRTLAFRDVATGARLHFARMQLRIGASSAPTPRRMAPVHTLLQHLGLASFTKAMDALELLDIEELAAWPTWRLAERLSTGEVGVSEGVGMTAEQARLFAGKVLEWRASCGERKAKARKKKDAPLVDVSDVVAAEGEHTGERLF